MMESHAHKLLLEMVNKLRKELLSQEKSHLKGSFEDINAFVVFRKASGVDRGRSIDMPAFCTALTNLDVKHDENLASEAYQILLSMDGGGGKTLEFRHVSCA